MKEALIETEAALRITHFHPPLLTKWTACPSRILIIAGFRTPARAINPQFRLLWAWIALYLSGGGSKPGTNSSEEYRNEERSRFRRGSSCRLKYLRSRVWALLGMGEADPWRAREPSWPVDTFAELAVSGTLSCSRNAGRGDLAQIVATAGGCLLESSPAVDAFWAAVMRSGSHLQS